MSDNAILERLMYEKNNNVHGGLYHRIQIDFAYNSNHIEGNSLSHEQTRYIFETNMISMEKNQQCLKIDDIVETANHFFCFDFMLENVNQQLSETFIKKLHGYLKRGTADSRTSWFGVGEYKKVPNEVAGRVTTSPEDVQNAIAQLLETYNKKKSVLFMTILEFHKKFEDIHPFQDGNGRVGRLIMFKECLKNNIVPFIISDDLKYFYYRGLQNWSNEQGFLRDTCLHAQDRFREYLRYFRVYDFDKHSADRNTSNSTN